MSFYRFPLTFGAMQGTSWVRAPSRRLLARTLSATMVLAFLAFPVFAQADSAGAQYQDRLPTATNKPTHHHPPGGGHHGQGSGNGGSSQGGGAGGGGGSSPPSGPNSSPSGASSRSNGAGNGGSSGGGGGAPTQGSGTDTVKLASNAGDQTGNSDGGSSPLVGILVGLGLGAIVSVLFVALRARRQRGDSEAVQTPHAG